jgi:hypothetical protein
MIQRTAHRLRRSMIGSLVILSMLLMVSWTMGTVGASSPATPDTADSTPTILNYQGIVRVDDEAYDGPTGHFKFAIVDAAAGDGTANYWANDGQANGEPATAVPLPVSEGLFNVLLGDTGLTGMSQAIDAAVFATEPAYLRVWFSPTGAAGSYEALEPNQRIASVAYALHAAYAENAPVNPNAHTVDGFHASAVPTANRLIALDDSAHLRVPRMVDSDNASFYADPASTSILSSLDVRSKLHNSNATYVDVNDDLRAHRFVDRQSTGYYVDPGGGSVIDNMWGNYFAVNEHQAKAGFTVGDSSSNDIDHGLRVLNPDLTGVWVSGSGDHGVWIAGAGDDGVNVSSAVGDGLHVGTTDAYGVNIYESQFSGVYVGNTEATGFYAENVGWGLYVDSAQHYGVNARGRAGGGFFRDADSGAYTYAAYGNYGVLSNRTKNFVQEHPTDPGTLIIYASLEGGEAGTYYRGTARLEQGTAVVKLPEHFSLVTEEEGLTVQVTPRADCMGLYVAEVTTRQIVVKELQGGTSNAAFDFTINGVRAGFADYQVMHEATDVMPDEVRDPKRGQPDG